MKTFGMVLVVVAGVLAAAPPVHAQEKVEVTGGYSFLNDTTNSQTFNGWTASVGGFFNRSFGVVGEVGGNYATISVLDTDLNISEFSFMGGPKYAARVNPKVTPFAQFLVGGVRLSGALLGVSESETDFAIQPGAGVDVGLAPNLALRLQGDYRMVRSDGDTLNHFRFVIGITFHQ